MKSFVVIAYSRWLSRPPCRSSPPSGRFGEATVNRRGPHDEVLRRAGVVVDLGRPHVLDTGRAIQHGHEGLRAPRPEIRRVRDAEALVPPARRPDHVELPVRSTHHAGIAHQLRAHRRRQERAAVGDTSPPSAILAAREVQAVFPVAGEVAEEEHVGRRRLPTGHRGRERAGRAGRRRRRTRRRPRHG